MLGFKSIMKVIKSKEGTLENIQRSPNMPL